MLFLRVASLVLFVISFVDAHVPMSLQFSSLFSNQETPLRKMRTLSMKMWGMVDAGMYDVSMAERFNDPRVHKELVNQIMVLNSMVDIFFIEITSNIHTSEYITHTIEEISHIQEVVYDTYLTYKNIVSSANSYTYAVNHLLEIILNKLAEFTEKGIFFYPYHACLSPFYPSAITPLSVPAYIIPVAPIS